MDSKKKMIIAISSFAMIILATVIAVVAVLAAQNVTIKSSIKVTYSVTDVVADVEVYATKVKTNATSISWGTAQTKDFGIDYEDPDGDGETLSFSSFSLAKDECVVLKFVFNNNSTTGFSATLTPTSTTSSNIQLRYSAAEATLLTSTTTTPTAVNVNGGVNQSGTYYAVIKIANNTQSATFDGSFDWVLTAA